MTDIWLTGDHYKWRAMRIAGVPEQLITGNDVPDKEKFLAWAKTVPLTLKNPLYHWTHLELKRYFGIDEQLNEETALEIWETTNEMLQSREFSTRNLLKKMKAQVVCSTDDAADSLEEHKQLEEEGYEDFVMFPPSGLTVP
jgi:glucuronate isomerase